MIHGLCLDIVKLDSSSCFPPKLGAFSIVSLTPLDASIAFKNTGERTRPFSGSPLCRRRPDDLMTWNLYTWPRTWIHSKFPRWNITNFCWKASENFIFSKICWSCAAQFLHKHVPVFFWVQWIACDPTWQNLCRFNAFPAILLSKPSKQCMMFTTLNFPPWFDITFTRSPFNLS